MARAVPRKVNEVKLFTGDIQGLCTGRDKVFACTSKGAIRYCFSPLQFLFSSFSYIQNRIVGDCLLTAPDLYASDPLFCPCFKQAVSSLFCFVSSNLSQKAFLTPEMPTDPHHHPSYREMLTPEMAGDWGNSFNSCLHWPDVSRHYTAAKQQSGSCLLNFCSFTNPSDCKAWNTGKKGELSEAGAQEKAHSACKQQSESCLLNPCSCTNLPSVCRAENIGKKGEL